MAKLTTRTILQAGVVNNGTFTAPRPAGLQFPASGGHRIYGRGGGLVGGGLCAVSDNGSVLTITNQTGVPIGVGESLLIEVNTSASLAATTQVAISESNTAAENAQIVLDVVQSSGYDVEVVFPPGQFEMGRILLDNATTPIKLRFRGCGYGVTVLRQQPGTQMFRHVVAGVDPIPGSYFEALDFTIYGDWETTSSLGTDANRHIDVRRVAEVRIQVESLWCRQMAITAQYCGDVQVESSRVKYCARDAINLTSCYKTRVVGNRIQHCNDDAIAVHVTLAQGNPAPEGHVIANNYMEDTFGIKMLGARHTAIEGNVGRRLKGYGAFLGWSDEFDEGLADQINVRVQGNVFTDIFQASLWAGFGSIQHGVVLFNRNTSATERVVGGATPVTHIPEDGAYSNNSSASKSYGAQGIVVTNNTLAQTLSLGGAYSDMGFNPEGPALGRSFAAGGWTDVDLSSAANIGAGNAVLVSGFTDNAQIADNDISGWSRGVRSDAGLVFELHIKRNRFFRIAGYCIDMETGALRRGMLQIEDNHFDLDPYLESGQRNADGTWTLANTAACALNCEQWEGAVMKGNYFKNLQAVARGSGTARVSYTANTYDFQPGSGYDLITFDGATNKGIGAPAGISAFDARIIVRDSTPTSATFGQILYNMNNSASPTRPSSGFYIAGQTVLATGVAALTGNQLLEAGATDPNPQYIIIGWRRMTTGSGHLLNTDWRELRCLTGN